jgi:signal transduction histidine kinase
MPLWRTIKVAAQDSVKEFAAIAVSAALLIVIFNLHLSGTVVIYPIILTVVVMAVYLFVKTLNLTRFYNRLEAVKISVTEEQWDNIVQNDIFETIAGIHNKHLSEIFRLRGLIEERNTLFSQFIHGMKSSVAVIELACDAAAQNGPMADITAENEKLKKGLEQSLNLLRLDAFANDYVPEKLELADLVKQIINEHKRDFIYADVYPKLSGSATVYSDPKWCGFIIGQVISNAVKYSEAGSDITFEINGHTLRVGDSGIGIPAEDLPRVFDMFFTGANGRRRKESTGIGLFMVKHIADKLGIKIAITSEVNSGTVVELKFPNLTKM